MFSCQWVASGPSFYEDGCEEVQESEAFHVTNLQPAAIFKNSDNLWHPEIKPFFGSDWDTPKSPNL